MFLKNGGISQVIAALLLIAITIAAAIMTYVFSMGLLGGLQAGGGQQTKQQLMLEAYDWTGCCPGSLKLWLRNIGLTDIVLADVFLNGLAANFHLGPCHNTIQIQKSCRAIVTNFVATITLGAAHNLKLVSVDGAMFSYSVTAGSAS